MDHKDEILQSAGETIEFARQYARQQMEYYRLEIAERTAKTTAQLITSMVVAIVVLVALIMLSIAGGFYLGSLLNSFALAFLCITGFYALLAFMVYVFRRKVITNPILTSILQTILEK